MDESNKKDEQITEDLSTGLRNLRSASQKAETERLKRAYCGGGCAAQNKSS